MISGFEEKISRYRGAPRRLILGVMAAAIATLCLGEPGSAQTPSRKPFRVVTTFTSFRTSRRTSPATKRSSNSITKPGAEIHDYQPTPLDIVRAQAADLVLWNGFNLERWFEKFFQNVKEVPSVVVTEGIEPMGIAEGPYTGKPNPHAWMSPSNALIYVENIRKALVKYDPANAEAYNRNAAAYAAKIKALDEPLRKRLVGHPGRPALAGDERRRVQLPDARLRHARSLSLADQRRRAGHAAAGPQGDRPRAQEQDSGGVQREHDLRSRRQAGRARDRRALRRRALCRLAQRRGRAGADLSRSPEGDGRDHRQGFGK